MRFMLALLPLLLLVGCSRQLSEEEKKRELRRRAELRLESGVVTWVGHAVSDSEQSIPIRLTTSVVTSSAGPDAAPVLQAYLNVGFFGGVELISSESKYDRGSGEYFATFAAGDGHGRLDLQATITEHLLTDASLTSAQVGRFRLIPREVAAESRATAMLAFRTTRGSEGRIQIEASSDRVDSPLDASVPYFAALEASLSFGYFKAVAHRAARVWYDPLKGTLSIWTEADGRIQLDGLFADNRRSGDPLGGETALISPLQIAHFYRGAEVVERPSVAFVHEGLNLQPLPEEPPVHFTGVLKGAESDFHVAVTLENTERVIQGKGSYFLNQFPEMRLKGVVCLSDQPYAYFSGDATRLDYLGSRLILQSSKTGVVLRFDWSSPLGMAGPRLEMLPQSSNRNLKPAVIELRAAGEAQPCAAD